MKKITVLAFIILVALSSFAFYSDAPSKENVQSEPILTCSSYCDLK